MAGMFALPFTIAAELIGPVLQVAGYAIVIVLAALDAVSWPYAIALFVIVVLVGQLQTAGAILIEEVAFRRYQTRD
jgi:biofilm PGA synthesis N-glycosyltransferase PgaC